MCSHTHDIHEKNRRSFTASSRDTSWAGSNDWASRQMENMDLLELVGWLCCAITTGNGVCWIWAGASDLGEGNGGGYVTG